MSKFVDATYSLPSKAPEIEDGRSLQSLQSFRDDRNLWIGLGALGLGAFLLYKLISTAGAASRGGGQSQGGGAGASW